MLPIKAREPAKANFLWMEETPAMPQLAEAIYIYIYDDMTSNQLATNTNQYKID